MKYIEFTFKYLPNTELISDILTAVLGDVGFDSFFTEEDYLKAFIQDTLLDEEQLKEALANFPIDVKEITYTFAEAENKNWNEEWEKNFFTPIVIGSECAIHSTFHKDIPEVQYDIIINPQMAFGTGHHETTSLIIEQLLKMDLKNKAILDMGCGTAILAILAHKKGASPVTAIDIDTWCVENAAENCELNRVEDMKILLGDANLLNELEPVDLVIANINRNILLQDMDKYAALLKKEGEIMMSGFYIEDIPLLEEKANALGLNLIHKYNKNNWASIHVKRV